jgi:predicted metal-binding membrane protein
MKDKVNFKNIYREWVSTIFGTVILVMAGIYLWENLKELNTSGNRGTSCAWRCRTFILIRENNHY